MKKYIALLLSLLLTFTIVPVSAFAIEGDVDLDMGDLSSGYSTYAITELEGKYKTQGRTSVVNNILMTDYSGSGIEFEAFCEGNVSVTFNSSRIWEGENGGNYFTVIVDGVKKPREFCHITATGDTTIKIAEGLSQGRHSFAIYNQNEIGFSVVGIKAVKLAGTITEPPKNKDLYIEFIGDSITTAYSNLAKSGETSSASPKYQDATQGYAYLTAKALDADFSIVASQGIGASIGYQTDSMNVVYPYLRYALDKNTLYDFSRQPDYIVIGLGTNDISRYSELGKTTTDVKNGFADMLSLVRSKNPNSKIIWIYNMMTDKANDLITSVISEAGGEQNGYYSLKLTQNNGGGAGHPYYTAHEVMAKELSNFIFRTEYSFIPGNVDDDQKDLVNLNDVVLLAQYVANWENLSLNEAALDVNGDGKISLSDVVYLAQYVAEWEGIELSKKPYDAKVAKIKQVVDFAVEVESGRDVRVLQLTDTQILDGGQARSATRFGGNSIGPKITYSEVYDRCYKYVKNAIDRTNPDLILLTGDIIYGEFDDSGRWFTETVNYIDSFGIPWAPIFGNHDNESQKGVTWQCEQFENAEHCLFKRGDITGNGNYSVGIIQDKKLIKTIYMMDSNGCSYAYKDGYGATDENGNPLTFNQGEKVKTTAGFGADQVEWLESSSKKIDEELGYTVSKFLGMHIPLSQFSQAAYESEYQSSADNYNSETYKIGVDVTAKNGDFGEKGERFKGAHTVTGLWDVLKQNSFDGVFVGHSHQNSVSILYDGIRLTFGLKAGTFDRYLSRSLGGTQITLNANGFKVKHIYYEEVIIADDEKIGGNVKAEDMVLGSSLSSLSVTETPINDGEKSYYAYKYYNGTVNSDSIDRILSIKPKTLTQQMMSDEKVTLEFDLYAGDDFGTAISSCYSLIRVKADGIKSTNFMVNTSDYEKSKWHHITIELTSETIQNFSLLLSEKTELGFYTASQSTIYLSNITLS